MKLSKGLRVEKEFRKVSNSPRMLHSLSKVLLVSKDLPQPFLEPFQPLLNPYSDPYSAKSASPIDFSLPSYTNKFGIWFRCTRCVIIIVTEESKVK